MHPAFDALEQRLALSEGVLDLSFGKSGKVTVDFGDLLGGGPTYAKAHSVAIQPDGKIVVAGPSSGNATANLLVSRLNPDGSLDSTFGNGGKVAVNVNAGGIYTSGGVMIQPDGKIVIAGSIGFFSPGALIRDPEGDVALVRLGPDGSLDTSFDGDGLAIVDHDPSNSGDPKVIAQAAALQPDGKILVGCLENRVDADFAVFRINGDGSPDRSFDGDGKQLVAFDRVEDGEDLLSGLAFQDDGKILLAGSASVRGFVGVAADSDFAVARLNADGSLDTTFGNGGEQTIGFDTDKGSSDAARAVAVQSDGKIVLAGYSGAKSSGFAAVRLEPSGDLDTTFGNGGKQWVDFKTVNYAEATAVAIQSDGKIVLAGTDYTGFFGVGDFAVARLNPDGMYDLAFGINGNQTIDFNNEDSAAALAIQKDGKLIVVGQTRMPTNDIDFAVARLLASSTTTPPSNPPPGTPPTQPGGTATGPGGPLTLPWNPLPGWSRSSTPGVLVSVPPPGTIWYVGGPPLRIAGMARLPGSRLGVTIAFSDAVRSQRAAARFYRLRSAGGDGRFGTRDDRSVRIASATYDAGSRSVTLWAAGRVPLLQSLQLIVSGRLTSASGARLDGNGDGWAGDDYVRVLE